MELSIDEDCAAGREETPSPTVVAESVHDDEKTGRPPPNNNYKNNKADGETGKEDGVGISPVSAPSNSDDGDADRAVDDEEAGVEHVHDAVHEQTEELELPEKISNGKIEKLDEIKQNGTHTTKKEPEMSDGVEEHKESSQEEAPHDNDDGDGDGGSVDSKGSHKESAPQSIDGNDTAADDDLPDNATDENSSRGGFPQHTSGSLNGSRRARTNNYLDEPTLSALREYLKSKEYAALPLEEEKVMEFTMNTHRNATDRTRYRKNLVEDFQVLGDNDNVYDLIYQEEEYFAMASKFFKDLVQGAQMKAGDFDLDRRTLAWLQRACGLKKPHDPLDQNLDDFSDSEEGEPVATGRRLTRGVKKERRKERMRKETEGISIFMEAVVDLERERKQPFKSNVQSYSYSEESKNEFEYVDEGDDDSVDYDDDNDDEGDSESSMSQDSSDHDSTAQIRDYPPESELIASIPRGDDMSVRIMFRGKVISSATAEELEEWHQPRKRRRAKERHEAQKRVKLQTQTQTDDEGEEQVLPEFSTEVIQRDTQTHSPENSLLEFFLPDLDDSIAALSRTGKSKPIEPIKVLTQSRICTKFYRFLGGRARRWARHEFYYPDLDAAWYGFDQRAASIALKIPMGVKLTWREWKAMRRQLNRPRRFSRAFVAMELSKRNRFRRMVRKLQRSPDSSRSLAFRVPSIVKPGTSVTAYNKRYQIVHQGTVLFYSRDDDGYFIQFDEEELGCEFCPDSEVASLPASGPPISARSDHYQSNSNQPSKSPSNLAGSVLDAESLSKNDRAYERFSLTSLIVNVERAKERKKAILDAMEEHNNFVSPYRRSKLYIFPKPPSGRMEALQETVGAWLHANLIHTNRSLRAGLDLLNAAYLEDDSSHSDSYASAGPSEAPVEENELELDATVLGDMAKRLIRSMGAKTSDEKLQKFTTRCLEKTVRKILTTPGR